MDTSAPTHEVRDKLEGHSLWGKIVAYVEHNWILWVYTQAAMLLVLLFVTLHAIQTTVTATFWTVWALSMVMAVFVLPAWAISWLGEADETRDAPGDAWP